MTEPGLRKLVTLLDEVHAEMGQPVDPPRRRAVAIAVIANPCAGGYEADLASLSEIGARLGALLTAQALAALGLPPERVESFGKGAIVGEAGEIEHAAAILHPKLGAPMRAALGGGAALVPSAKKRGGLGCALDLPLGHRDAADLPSHLDAMEVRVADAPRAGEILVAIGLAAGPRPLARRDRRLAEAEPLGSKG